MTTQAHALSTEAHTQDVRPRGGTEVVIDQLTRSFGGVKALDDLSLTIGGGEFVALLGPSGCGKTTALRVLAGFEQADAGRVLLDGVEVSRLAPQRRGMGMVFQSYSLFPNMTAQENVAFGLRLRKQNKQIRRDAAERHLDAVGLSQHSKKYPHQLSGGQQQRVALARALAIEPKVLLLDEPLSALDAKVRAELRDQIRSLQQRLGITTVFVTHDQEEALSMADRVCVLRDGHVEQLATPAELYRSPSTAFVAEFVGTSSRLSAQRDGDRAVVLGASCLIRRGTNVPVGRVDALVRPEDLGVNADRDGAATVISQTFLGAMTRLEILIGASIVKVDVRSDEASELSPSTRVEVHLKAADVLLVESLS